MKNKITLKYKGFIGQYEFDESINSYVGYVVNVGDIITFQGKTLNKLEKEFHNSVEDYLEWSSTV